MFIRKYFKQMPLLDGGGDGSGGTGPVVDDNGNPGKGSGEDGGNINPGAPNSGLEEPTVNFPEGLDDAIKADPSLKVFINDKGDINYANMMKSYVHAQKQMGKDKVIIPDKNASEDDWNSFFNKMGRPELDKYELSAGENEIDENVFKGFKEIAHNAGVLPGQAQKIFDWFQHSSAGIQEEAAGKETAAQEEAINGLKKEWGEGFDKEVNLANRALKEFASEDEMKYLVDSGLADDVNLVRLFNKVGKGLSEDTFTQESHGSFGMTPDEAQSQINEMFMDSEGAYLNAEHTNHKEAVQKMMKLQTVAAGA